MANTEPKLENSGKLLTEGKAQPATLGFIGGGNMAASLIGGLVADGYDPGHILISDPSGDKLASLAARYGVRSVADNPTVASRADLLVLAVKPQVLREVCEDLAATVQQHRPLLLSIAAGVREAAIQRWLGEGLALVRTMPNTPAMIQAGAIVLHAGDQVSTAQRDLAESVMRAVGLTLWVKEEAQMDAVTALSGSGPAYFFLVMEAMEQAGVELGLDADDARLLCIQTALGAARMAMESPEPPAELRRRVTSPGGTTERALEMFEQGGLRSLFSEALKGAHDRSEELSQMLAGED